MAQSHSPDIRWKQRFNNFSSAYMQLKVGVETARSRDLNDLEKQGLIQAFEYTHELAWNVMKDYFEFQGASQIRGSRDATREAFQKTLITDGDTWMEMIESRNDTSHTYQKKVALEIINKIINRYQAAFEDFHILMNDLAAK